MISYEQEEKIRELLEEGALTAVQIGEEAGVSFKTVQDISRIVKHTKRLMKNDPEIYDEIRRDLMRGVPIGAIAMRLRIPDDVIYKVRRFNFFHRRNCGDLERRCPECNAPIAFGPCEDTTFSPADTYAEGAIRRRGRAMAEILQRIVGLCSLGLDTLRHPLLYSIFRDAKEIVDYLEEQDEENET